MKLLTKKRVKMLAKCTYCFMVPFLGEINKSSMYDEENIDNDKQMVRVPKCIISCEALDHFWELKPILSKHWVG